jgi:hypothetical protein
LAPSAAPSALIPETHETPGLTAGPIHWRPFGPHAQCRNTR